MGLIKPYKRTARTFTEEKIKKGGLYRYIHHKEYADSPEHFIRAFLIIQKDFINILDYIEPADQNLETYSFRLHELLTRICIEIESNCVAILKENGYTNSKDWGMNDYKKINNSHHLSSFDVKLSVWSGEKNVRTPFKNWNFDKSLEWWRNYTTTKHNRHQEFEKATFGNLIDAMCGLVVILSSQFQDRDFALHDYICMGNSHGGWEVAIGNYFLVKYPDDWTDEEKYDFSWSELQKEPNPIDEYNYND